MALKTLSRRPVGRQRPTPPRPGRSPPALPTAAATPPAYAATDLPADPPVDPTPQRTHETATRPDPLMLQAKHDLDAGLVDTDLRATAGLDAPRRARLVSGAGGQPPGSGR